MHRRIQGLAGFGLWLLAAAGAAETADEIVARIEAEGFPTRVLDAPGGRETGRRS